MKASVTKIFTFDAAHKIPNHDGKCRELHGHTYRLEVTVKGVVDPNEDNSTHGMVIDFADIKRVFKDHIEPLVDHKYLNETIPVPVTTAEVLAGWIWKVYADKGMTPCSVRLWETPTSYAQIGNGDLI